MRNQIKKVELLAPAGNYECFRAAVYAGADAVYLAGSKFGARAYADNFSQEELLSAIRYAHLFGRKVYMTVNTLVKEQEMQEIVPYLKPYYQAGLDGVIVQDIGVFSLLKREFPEMELHCSTQMTITSVEGARFAQELGATRIVPARELSLVELRTIHAQLPELELECFIHGALCYCYSGQCLLSSMIGGRSGNRGTCAQPCRLPYDVTVQGETQVLQKYPLSLKDLCTARLLPELIDAGIASFKIEGRMKSAEYCCGVTSVYRQLIDRYKEAPESYSGPTGEEMRTLEQLYIRSEVQDGYYHCQNGKQMITAEKPSYSGSDTALTEQLHERYCEKDLKHPIQLEAVFQIGKPAVISCRMGGYRVTVQGDEVQAAAKRPMSEEDIKKQLIKCGGTYYEIEQLKITMDQNVFVPVSRLNELRRDVLNRLTEELLSGTTRIFQKYQEEAAEAACITSSGKQASANRKCHKNGSLLLSVAVTTTTQLEQCAAQPEITNIYVDPYLLEGCSESIYEKQVYLRLPRILRERDIAPLRKVCDALAGRVTGFYVDSVDAVHFASGYHSRMILGPTVYNMNRESLRVWSEKAALITLPYECNERELYELTEQETCPLEMVVYGRIPLMVTANCIVKSFGKTGCVHTSGIQMLRDRKQQNFPVLNHCRYCYNELYNSIPLSLHKHINKLSGISGIQSVMLYLTLENAEETAQMITFYDELLQHRQPEVPVTEYTNGHFGRGVL